MSLPHKLTRLAHGWLPPDSHLYHPAQQALVHLLLPHQQWSCEPQCPMLLAEELLLYHDPSCVCSPKTLVVKLHLIAYTRPIQQSRQRTNSIVYVFSCSMPQQQIRSVCTIHRQAGFTHLIRWIGHSSDMMRCRCHTLAAKLFEARSAVLAPDCPLCLPLSAAYQSSTLWLTQSQRECHERAAPLSKYHNCNQR